MVQRGGRARRRAGKKSSVRARLSKSSVSARSRPVLSRRSRSQRPESGFVITKVFAREILDSRGNPTVEAEVTLKNCAKGRAAVPSGASTGKHEAVELRDGGKEYLGQGVLKAVANVNGPIAKRLIGADAKAQRLIDDVMIGLDGTENKSTLGANAMLAVSIATSRAVANGLGKEYFEYLCTLTGREPTLPIPFCNVINGGKHAGGKLKPQEFMIVPVGARTFAEAAQMASETYHVLKGLLKEAYGVSATNVGDEGGFAPPLSTPEEALDLLRRAIAKAGYGGRIAIALDPAASELYVDGMYDLGFQTFTPEQLVAYWKGVVKKYAIVSLEDGFEQDDFLSWRMLRDDVRREKIAVQLVGDDMTVTNPERIRMAIDHKLCNVLLLKVNQVGTLSEALDAAKLAFDAGWNVMVSHRSGETEDPFIADLAVALGCGQIKLGAPCRSDRVAKYNQLLRIEERLGKGARYPRLTLPKV